MYVLSSMSISESYATIDRTNIEKSKDDKSEIIDGGWGWAVTVAAVLIRLIVTGLLVTFGLFIKEFVLEYKVSQTTVSWMASLLSTSMMMISPVVGIVAQKLGHRLTSIIGLLLAGVFFATPYFYSSFWFLFVTSSVLTGASMGFAFTCSAVILRTYFDRKLSIVMGMLSAATGAASFVMVPLVNVIIVKYNWRVAMLAYGGILWFAALLAITFRPAPQREKKTEEQRKANDIKQNDESIKERSKGNVDKEVNEPVVKIEIEKTTDPEMTIVEIIKDETDVKSNEHDLEAGIPESEKEKLGYLIMLKDPIFIVFLISIFLTNLGYDTTYVYAKEKALEAGISQAMATFLMTSIGIGSLTGRLLFGFLGAVKKLSTYQMFIWCLIFGGICIISSKFATILPLMLIHTIGFGFFIGGAQPLTTMVLTQITNFDNFSKGLACVFIAEASGLLLCSPLAGFLYDLTKTYDWSFLLSGCVTLTSGVVLYLNFISKSFRRKQNKKTNQ